MARPKGIGPSQADLAAALDLSVSTVSRALSSAPGISDDVRQRVTQMAAQLGYRTKGMAPRHDIQRLVVVATIFDVNGTISWVYQEMLHGITASARESAIPIECHMTMETHRLPTGLGPSLGPAVGVVFLGFVPDTETIRWLAEHEISAIIVNGVDPTLQMDSVSPANYFGGRTVANYLCSLGHRKVGFLGGPNRWTLIRRFRGFRDALADHWGADDSIVGTLHLHSDTTQAYIDQLRAWLPDFLEKATALFCYNDSLAVSAIQTISDLGKSVPGDVSVVGFDDMPLGTMMTPKLTTFHIDWQVIGAEALRQLRHRHSSQNGDALELQVGGRLVERQSAGPCGR